MKRLITFAVIAVFILAALSGCNVPSGNTVDEPVPTSTPEPEGIERVFGKTDVRIAVINGSDEFFAAAQSQAGLLGIDAERADEKKAADYDAAIVYAPSSAVEVSGVPLIVFTDDASLVPENGLAILYSDDDALWAAADALLTYDSHCTPIRTVALEAADDSKGAQLIQGLADEGKLMLKGVLAGADAQATAELLDSITVGLLDTVFAENEELAIIAFDALKNNYRNDLVEVITPVLTPSIVKAMAEDHYLMGAAAGVNEWSAGALAVRMAAALVAGENVEDVKLAPTVVYSSDIYALELATDEEIAEYVRGLSSDDDKLYAGDSIAYLADYYEE